MTMIGILGCGTVGGGLARLLGKNHRRILARTGQDVRIHSILVRDGAKPRPGLERWITLDPNEVVDSPEVDVVVEALGGLHPARELILRALRNQKAVVTANKAVLAHYGDEIFGEAERRNLSVGFEGCVGGAIPIVRTIREALAADEIRSIRGVLNGTTNFILTRMARTGAGLEEALTEARRRGFCEHDADSDLSGADAAQKLSLLIRIAFGISISPDEIPTEGIAGITPDRMNGVRESGHVLKLVASAERTDRGIVCRVRPEVLPLSHPLAAVDDEQNAIALETEAAGPLVLRGRGAGALPTASVMLADVLNANCPAQELKRIYPVVALNARCLNPS